MVFDIDSLNKVFRSKLESDKDLAPRWMVDWAYQSVRKKRKKKYENELPQDFFKIESVSDLVKWYNWFLPEYPNYFPDELTSPLVKISRKTDQAIFSKLDLTYDFENYYDKRIGINNAHDALYPRFYPVPDRMKIKTVLDFGAGSGRQSNLWHRHLKSTFIGMDATPKAYALQYIYYSTLKALDNDDSLCDYVYGGFDSIKNDGRLYHLPTWRFDLIPDNSVDLVICIQVLHELSGKLVKYAINQFLRVLKPGGMLYIRDNPWWTNSDTLDVDSYLKANGFVTEFKPYIQLNKEMIGLPRMYRKKDIYTEQLITNDSKMSLLKKLYVSADTRTNGKLSSIIKRKY